MYPRNGQWRQAEQSLRRAIQIGRSLATPHELLARFVLWPLGRISEASDEMRSAGRFDPLSAKAHLGLADVLLTMGRFDEAAKQCEQAPEDAVFRKECLGRARLGQGRTAEAIRGDRQTLCPGASCPIAHQQLGLSGDRLFPGGTAGGSRKAYGGGPGALP